MTESLGVLEDSLRSRIRTDRAIAEIVTLLPNAGWTQSVPPSFSDVHLVPGAWPVGDDLHSAGGALRSTVVGFILRMSV